MFDYCIKNIFADDVSGFLCRREAGRRAVRNIIDRTVLVVPPARMALKIGVKNYLAGTKKSVDITRNPTLLCACCLLPAAAACTIVHYAPTSPLLELHCLLPCTHYLQQVC